MRPETFALTFTKRLGLTSPEAETTETRSRRPTFWVWTGIRFRESLVTLKATTPPRTSTAATPTAMPGLLRRHSSSRLRGDGRGRPIEFNT